MTYRAYALGGAFVVGEGDSLGELDATGAWVASNHTMEVRA